MFLCHAQFPSQGVGYKLSPVLLQQQGDQLCKLHNTALTTGCEFSTSVKQTSAFTLKENWTQLTYTKPTCRIDILLHIFSIISYLKSTQRPTKFFLGKLKVVFVLFNSKNALKPRDKIMYKAITNLLTIFNESKFSNNS